MKIESKIGSVDIQIDTLRLDKNLREAQILLNEQVAADCNMHIPFRQGALRNSVCYPEGIDGGEICWNTPYAHYQYAGELYLTKDGKSWAGKGEKKYPAGKPLEYHTAGTGSNWFESAKLEHGKDWLELVKQTVGKE